MKSDNENLTWQQQVEYRKVKQWGRDSNMNNRIRLLLSQRSRVSVSFEPTAEEVLDSINEMEVQNDESKSSF